MGFSFRKKKSARTAIAKKNEAAAEEAMAKKSKKKQQSKTELKDAAQKKTLVSGGSNSNQVISPLGTIDEAHDEGRPEETPAGVLESLNIVPSKEPGTYDTQDTDESFEVVTGDTDTDAGLGVTKEEDITHEEVKKVLFGDGEEQDEKEESQERTANFSAALEDQPFDAKAEYEVDEMLDLEKTLPSDFGRKNREDMLETNVTRKLLDVFNCGEDTTQGTDTVVEKGAGLFSCASDLFYDTVCGSYVNGQKRPYYNLQFTLKFLEEATKRGIPLLNHQPPKGEDVEDWTGRSVTMFVRPGNTNGAKLIQPSLEWSTLGGGWSRTGTSEVVTTKIGLLDIHSILDSSSIEEERDDDDGNSDMCFFSITTRTGDVHVFEAQSYEERDRIVNGLKNVIARLAYHLVAGDVQVSSELYSEDYGQASGELPSLRTPTRAMNDISHSFLD